jgi:hypothetical protein
VKQYLHLAPDEKALEGGVIHVNIFDVDFLNRFRMGLDLGERRLHVGELTMDRK